MKDIIIKILEKSVNAPSGDNSQPWKFKIENNLLKIFNISDADPTLYNYKQRGSFIAHGALLENILICSNFYGLSCTFDLFPNNTPELIANLTYSKSETKEDVLFSFINTRHTNRKAYKTRSLSSYEKNSIFNVVEKLNFGNLKLIEDKNYIDQLSGAISLNERLILENKKIHKTLFSFIRWTKNDEEKNKNGLYIKTLELAPPQEKAFKLLSNWKVANFFNKFDIGKIISKDSAKLYSKSSAFGLITINNGSTESYINAGRLFQRIWLTISKNNLNLQPVTALIYLAQRIKDGDTEHFSKKHIDSILEVDSTINSLFSINNEIPVMLFRVGESENPTATSIKKKPHLF